MKIHRLFFALIVCLALAVSCGTLFAADGVKKGTPEAPPNGNAIVGSYYRGDGTGYNIYLTLNKDGTYAAKWCGCLGKYGDAAGKWILKDRQIIFKPTEEKDMMVGHLKSLDIFKFKGEWIFVPSAERESYDKWGVSRYSCFQKREEK